MIGKKVTKIAGMLLVVGFCTFGAMMPQAKAQYEHVFDQRTIFTFSGPVEVPGKTLDAGTYVFKVVDVAGDRDIVQVSNKNESKVYGTFLTIPDYRMKPTGKTVLTFTERAAGAPEAVKVWFYPGQTYGHQFVYPKTKAVQLAKANNTPVPSMPDEVTPANTAAMKQAPLKAQQPNEQEVEIAEVFVVPPATSPTELPKTASQLPLIGLVGLLSIAMAFSLRLAAAKIK
jgi:hypothetical protein